VATRHDTDADGPTSNFHLDAVVDVREALKSSDAREEARRRKLALLRPHSESWTIWIIFARPLWHDELSAHLPLFNE
jgi:hypothetical protein